MAWVDIAIIVIILVYAILGLSRGFLKSLLRFFGTIATLALSILLSKPVSGLFEQWFGLNSKLGEFMSTTLAPYCSTSTGGPIDNFFMNKFAEMLQELGSMDKKPEVTGRNIFMYLIPIKK